MLVMNENENAIDLSLPGTSTSSVDVSRCRSLISEAEINVKRVMKPSLVFLKEMRARVKRVACVGKHLSVPKLHKSP